MGMMPNQERVLHGLNSCGFYDGIPNICEVTECPYRDDKCGCVHELAHDAGLLISELLKAQEPKVMTLEEVIEAAKQGEPMYICEAKFPGSARWIIPINADHWGFEERGSHCQFHYYDYLSKQIGGFCCWTAEPTDEQKETVKWDA